MEATKESTKSRGDTAFQKLKDQGASDEYMSFLKGKDMLSQSKSQAILPSYDLQKIKQKQFDTKCDQMRDMADRCDQAIVNIRHKFDCTYSQLSKKNDKQQLYIDNV